MLKPFTVLFFLLSFLGNAQTPMNSWQIHFSVSSSIDIASTDKAIYMATSNGISKYDIEDNSISTLTLAKGLSDLNITAINANNNIVAIGYLNGNIDIINENEITNVPWVKKFQISGSKKINNFYFSDDKIYVATNLGIVIYDISKNEIEDTYNPYLNSEVNDITINNDTLYAATNNGIYFAHKSSDFLNDYTKWNKKMDLPIHLTNSKISDIETFNNQLFFISQSLSYNEDTLYFINNKSLQRFYNKPVNLERIKVVNGELLIVNTSVLDIVNNELDVNEVIYDYTFGISPRMTGATYLKKSYWIADKNNGMVKAANTWNNSQIYSNTPFSDGCYKIDIQYGKMLVAGGGLTQNLQSTYSRNGAYVYDDGSWTNINYNSDPEMNIDSTWDVISTAINPNNTDQMAFGTFSKGALKVVTQGNSINKTYDQSNSPLEIDQNGFYIISHLNYDNDGNLWVANAGNEPLKMLSKDGIWHTFNLGSAAKNKFPTSFIIDRNGNKWIAFSNLGIVVYNENGTFDDPSDDQSVFISTNEGYGSLPSSAVKSICEDIDGEIWIGTESGLAVIFSTASIFDGGYGDADASQIVFKYGEENETLLGETSISSITIDGGNRKWIGTASSGVFCLSPNGTEEVYRFDTDNSPLLSNGILDIKVNQQTGEVYFATESGLISYRADATIADNEFNDVKVFPNPIRPNYAGDITIQGLGYESNVKITDVSGNLIYQTVSNGGTVTWNGKRLTGERVQSGVYLVWSASSTGKGKNVAKILFIN